MKNDIIVLNRPRKLKRGLTIEACGRLTFRSVPCKLLRLTAGKKIVFIYKSEQLYIIQSDRFENSIRLYGRDGQLHGNSVSTTKAIISNYLRDVPPGTREIDLVVAGKTEDINIDGAVYPALAVINRADKEHCR